MTKHLSSATTCTSTSPAPSSIPTTDAASQNGVFIFRIPVASYSPASAAVPFSAYFFLIGPAKIVA